MAEKTFPGGMMMLYGGAISTALAHGHASVDELTALRSQAKALMDVHGDLAAALGALDQAIASRGGAAAKSGPPEIPPQASHRFVVQISGLQIAADFKTRIEQVINSTIRAAVAELDLKGDLVMTPLSQIKSYGGGLGGATAGMIMQDRGAEGARTWLRSPGPAE